MDDKNINSLRARWDDLTSFVAENTKEKWWNIIINSYSKRHFYNLNHLVEMFNHYDKYKDLLNDRYAMAFAVFFKHIEYDPRSSDNAEKSAKKLREFSQETTFDQENYVANLIIQSESNCTDAHTSDSNYGSDDIHYLIDFDFSFLGLKMDEYMKLTESIRKEYSYLSDQEYKEQRLKVLKLFLQIPNIYATKEFREAFEENARNNIQNEINLLSK